VKLLDRTGSVVGWTFTAPITSYAEYRLVYKNVPNTVGTVKLYVDGVLEANTFASVSTVGIARPILWACGRGMGSKLTMNVDYYAFVPLDGLAL
jgi:hypothetical protein